MAGEPRTRASRHTNINARRAGICVVPSSELQLLLNLADGSVGTGYVEPENYRLSDLPLLNSASVKLVKSAFGRSGLEEQEVYGWT